MALFQDNPAEPAPEKDTSPFLDFYWPPIGCWNSPTLVCHCMTASWLEASTQTKAGEPKVPRQDFTSDALPSATLSIYPGLRLVLSMLDCTLRALCGMWTPLPLCMRNGSKPYYDDLSQESILKSLLAGWEVKHEQYQHLQHILFW